MPTRIGKTLAKSFSVLTKRNSTDMELDIKSFSSGFLAGCLAYGLAKWVKEKRQKKNVMETLLFSPVTWSDCSKSSDPCKILACPICNYKLFLSVLQSTRSQLDICVYLITLRDLTDTIISLFKNGIFVRIITDKDMSNQAHNSKTLIFIKEHIPIKLIQSAETMHNKFAIIDGKILITGSFNWTKQAFTQNFENGVIIDDDETVQKFCDYFDGMWLSS